MNREKEFAEHDREHTAALHGLGSKPTNETKAVLPNGHIYEGMTTLSDGQLYVDASYTANHLPHECGYTADEVRVALNSRDELLAERDRLLEVNAELLAATKDMLPIFEAFLQDELSITTLDEAASIMPKYRAAIAKAERRA